jgi:carboxymethylenebutenolidase
MSARIVEIATQDGICPTHVFEPSAPHRGGTERAGPGPWPGVIMYMDGPGLRPALFAMAQRLADNGYLVILPDLFYRLGGADPVEQKLIFTDPEKRKAWIARYLPVASLTNVRRDTAAFLRYLDDAPNVLSPRVGTTGYCMGGGHSLTAAGAFPDRVVAAASYHGGGLATDAPESPHRLAGQMKARIYVACADDDPLFPEAMKTRLAAALHEAGVDFVVETYAGARHGFVPSDTPVYDERAAERHWETLVQLLDGCLKG